MHINAIGANHAHKRELDDEAVSSADVIVVDSIEQSRQEAGDLIIAFRGDEVCWTGVKKLSDVVAKKSPGRTSDTEVTLFKSNGIASWDLAVAMKVYALAKEKGLGRELPFWAGGAEPDELTSALVRRFLELPAQCVVKTGAHFARQFDRFAIAENLNRLLRLIHDQLAVGAVFEMALEFPLQRGIEFAVDEIRKFVNDVFAVQFVLPC